MVCWCVCTHAYTKDRVPVMLLQCTTVVCAKIPGSYLWTQSVSTFGCYLEVSWFKPSHVCSNFVVFPTSTMLTVHIHMYMYMSGIHAIHMCANHLRYFTHYHPNAVYVECSDYQYTKYSTFSLHCVCN